MSTDQEIEQDIQAKGLTAPRVTPSDIEAEILSEHYFSGADGVLGYLSATDADPVQAYQSLPPSLFVLTFCVLALKNGFIVTGESACASHDNFDAEIGRRIARANAVTKIWPLLGFRLRDRLSAS